ncbi:MAG: Xaa-Pro aminopeptidase [Candidatus Izemoplasmatales bacterium]|nr:Xaa-Pro aminopeptidase [Candidatus Izemoplasmatales bacterium]
MNSNEFIERRKILIDELLDNSFALLASGEAMHKTWDQFHKYIPNRNFFYLTGLMRENFVLFLAKDDSQIQEYIFIEEASDYANKWLGKRLTKEEVAEISGIDIKNILYVQEFRNFIASRVLTDSRASLLSKVPENLYLDMFRYRKMKKPVSFNFFSEIIDNYPELYIKDLGGLISDMRRIKTKAEVLEIQKAIDYTQKGIEAIWKNAKPGINEAQLEALFEYTIKVEGSKGVSFDTIVASGKNGTVLHYVENDQKIEDNSLVLLDLGALSNLYAGDISRTFPVNGKFTERQSEFYQMVLDVNKKTIEMIKPGVYVKELNDFARDMLAEGMIRLGKIKEKSEISKYYYHNVSHYLGLDVHDVGTYSQPLSPGAVITVEPGIYIEEEAIGIRIEDDVLVTSKGHENLSKNIIKEIKDIEDFMK